jgi:predicted transcriptional regulator
MKSFSFELDDENADTLTAIAFKRQAQEADLIKEVIIKWLATYVKLSGLFKDRNKGAILRKIIERGKVK